MGGVNFAQPSHGFPAFLLAYLMFFWSSALVPVLRWRQFLDLRGLRCDLYTWSLFMKQFFQYQVMRVGTTKVYKPKTGKVAYLCNHRSWADFMVDPYLTQGNAALLSRWLVFWAFPIFMATAITLKRIFLFKRDQVKDKEKFNAWLDSQLAHPLVPGILVYPEGHRSTKPTSQPLKRGMLHYIHSRKMPVQLVISKGKEDAWSEKRLTASWGATVVVGYSEPIFSEGKEFEAFAAEINSVWDKMWREVYAADHKRLLVLVQDDVPMADYPMAIRLKLLCVACLFALPMFILFVLGLVKAWLWMTVSLGPVFQQLCLLLAVSWTVTTLKKVQGS